MIQRMKNAYAKARSWFTTDTGKAVGGSHDLQEIQYVRMFHTAASIAVNWMKRATAGLEFVVLNEDNKPVESAESLRLTQMLNRRRGEFLATAIQDRAFQGNAYYEIRDDGLHYIVNQIVKPADDFAGKNLRVTDLGGIEVNDGTNTVMILAENLLHIKHGIHPEKPALGISPLVGVMDDLLADDQSSLSAAAMLFNMARMGNITSPKDGQTFSDKEIAEIQAAYRNQLSKGDVGGEFISPKPIDVKFPEANSLKGIAMAEVRNYAETRICAGLGLQPSIVGFLGGISQSRVGAVQTSMLRETWQAGVIPTLNDITDQAGDKLLERYGFDSNRFRLRVDVSKVMSRWETPEAREKRLGNMVKNGVISAEEARAEHIAAGDISEENMSGEGDSGDDEDQDGQE